MRPWIEVLMTVLPPAALAELSRRVQLDCEGLARHWDGAAAMITDTERGS